jgi:hypothetical protein
MACLNDIVLYNHLPLSHPLSQSKFEDTAIPQPSYNYQCISIIQGGSTTIANGLWHEVIPSIIAILFGMVCSLMLPSLREKGSLLATPIHTALASAIVETEGSSPTPLPARGEGRIGAGERAVADETRLVPRARRRTRRGQHPGRPRAPCRAARLPWPRVASPPLSLRGEGVGG